MSPWALPAMPFWASTRNGLMAPVLACILPTAMGLYGVPAANHRLPAKSAAASWGREATREVVPLVQSEPSFGGVRDGRAWSGLRGTSYSVKTARAASPDGRGRRV